ncbi:MAG: protein GlmU [Desulfobacteraceae bacterium]|nr:protein GlmU [Desulfobacteraceae bacterium]
MNNLIKHTKLMDKGVTILNPESVLIGEEVDLDRISGTNVTIYPGVRLFGEKTLICSGVKIGKEAPVTIENCYIGPDTTLKGGFFQGACFAGKNSFGSSAHVREGTILEEEASAAHCVGLKQTILFPYVTLGSLINFCDCFMAGGTGRKNHSEVGSSFIHFNYTPNQDKATAFMGNVYQGVLLNQNPIFLGGQGGLVGPCKIGFGCLTVAGSIIRKDELKSDRLLLGGSLREASIAKGVEIYKNVSRVYNNNITYIASLTALMNWYREIRSLFSFDYFSKELYNGMVKTLEIAIDERIKRLEEFVKKLEISKQLLLSTSGKKTSTIAEQHSAVINNFPENKEFLINQKKVDFSDSIPKMVVNKNNYIEFIKNLDSAVASKLSRWLYSIEYKIIEKVKL